ncbi:hypothetical protein DXG03_004147, partial [Asterophora parasitica]
MPPRILVNPNEVTCPDFALPDWAAARGALISGTLDDATAIIRLTESWNANNFAEKAMWARQLAQEERDRIEAKLEQEQRDEEMEDRKKHSTKYTPISENPPPDTMPIFVSPYALARLRKGQYVEMWYFTNDGISYAQHNSTMHDEDTMVQVADKDSRA